MPTSSSIFVDTSGWGCYLDAHERSHAEAVTILQAAARQRRRLVTTNYVITELVVLLSGHLHFPRQNVLKAVDALKTTALLDILYVDQSLDDEAWALLKARPDKEWSLVDATSIVIMTQRGMTEALTTDHHFSQAGLIRLLAP